MTKPYKVEYLETNPIVDITEDVLQLERMDNNGLPDINTAAIVLDGNDGAFQTNDNGGTTPILQGDWDRFRITYFANGLYYSRIFELDVDLFSKDTGGKRRPD